MGFSNSIEERDLDSEYFDDESFWGNWEGDRSVGEEAEKLELGYEHAGYSAVESDYKEPRTYREMMKRPVSEREKWLEGMKKEFNNFERRRVWRKIKIKVMPEGRKLVGCK